MLKLPLLEPFWSCCVQGWQGAEGGMLMRIEICLFEGPNINEIG